MTINESLSGMASEMSIVGKLGPDERPRQGDDHTINGIYERAVNIYDRNVQAFDRATSGQHSCSALKRIELITNKIIHYANRNPSPFEYQMTYSSQIEIFAEILRDTRLALESGLPNFLETSRTSSSSVFSQSETEISKRKALFETTTTMISTAENILKQKIVKYKNRNRCACERGLPPMRAHLHETIELILNPEQEFNTSTLPINGYQTLCADITKEILIESFGKEHVEEVLRFYDLDYSVNFTYPDLQAIIIGIVANITFRDIEIILKKTDGIAYKILEEKFQKKIPNTLDEKSTLFILDTLRTIDVGGAYCPKNRHYEDQLYGDLLFIESCKSFGDFALTESADHGAPLTKLRKFGRIEQFAREYVYAFLRTDDHKFKQGVLFPSFDENGKVTCFEGHHVFKANGIRAFASIPQPDISACHNLVNISFRGTYDDKDIPKHQCKILSSSMWSMWSTPDEIAFEKENDSIIHNFISIANKVNSAKKLEVEICGQGIGGCAAQRFAEALSNHFTKNMEVYQDSEISEVKLYCFDSPAIEEPIVERFIKDCFTLPELKFTLRYFSSNIPKNDWYAEKHYLGFLGSESQRVPTNLNISFFNFSFIDDENSPEKLFSERPPVKLPDIDRIYVQPPPLGNNDSFFSKQNKYKNEEPTPVHLNYYCTSNNDDRKLIPQGKKVDVESLPEVLTVGFKHDSD